MLQLSQTKPGNLTSGGINDYFNNCNNVSYFSLISTYYVFSVKSLKLDCMVLKVLSSPGPRL